MCEVRKPACLSSTISTRPWTRLGGHGGGGPGVGPPAWLLQVDSPLKPSRRVWKAAGTAALPQARSPQHRLEAQLPSVDGLRPVCEEGRRQGLICFPLMATRPVRSREQRLPPAGQLLSYRRRGPALGPHPSASRLTLSSPEGAGGQDLLREDCGQSVQRMALGAPVGRCGVWLLLPLGPRLVPAMQRS